jgi:hypothetical protein
MASESVQGTLGVPCDGRKRIEAMEWLDSRFIQNAPAWASEAELLAQAVGAPFWIVEGRTTASRQPFEEESKRHAVRATVAVDAAVGAGSDAAGTARCGEIFNVFWASRCHVRKSHERFEADRRRPRRPLRGQGLMRDWARPWPMLRT